jgi:hypothetical protein
MDNCIDNLKNLIFLHWSFWMAECFIIFLSFLMHYIPDYNIADR